MRASRDRSGDVANYFPVAHAAKHPHLQRAAERDAREARRCLRGSAREERGGRRGRPLDATHDDARAACRWANRETVRKTERWRWRRPRWRRPEELPRSCCLSPRRRPSGPSAGTSTVPRARERRREPARRRGPSLTLCNTPRAERGVRLELTNRFVNVRPALKCKRQKRDFATSPGP